ncbi:MAG: DUF1566 domain-containing protein [Proteobacteria bacterium]|nr:DUF1566 domain-containing protein [Pseudomonadota bacterium]MBU2627803.1 DUF1566 domain-containing protein [Pseudomonadota bacterium]
MEKKEAAVMECKIKQIIGVDSFFARSFVWKCIMATIMVGIIVSLSSCLLLRAQNYGDVVAEDESFIQYSIGIVIDKRTNLMWAQADNGDKLSIEEAKVYAMNFNLGGYTDWRLPDIKELESLMVYYQRNKTEPSDGCSGNYVIHPFFALTCCCPWALQDDGKRPASYPFIKGIATGSSWHHKSHTMGNRVLPIRNIK